MLDAPSMRAALVSAAILLSGAALAQDSGAPAAEAGGAATQDAGTAAQGAATQGDAVVARIGDQTITEDELTLAAEEFGQQLAQVPEPRRRDVLISVLVDMKLLAQAARERGLDQGEDFRRRLDFLTTRALRNAYVEDAIVGAVTDEEVRAEYDRQIAAFPNEEEVRARHILVPTREEALAVLEQLKGGADFAELATAKSIDKGTPGGDLGYFGKGRMVPEFEAAAFALQPGETVSEPVQSQFGWHVIRVEDRRRMQPPPFETVQEQVRGALVQKRFEETIAALRQATPVEIVGAPAAGDAPAAGAAPAAGDAPAAAEAPAGADAPAADAPATGGAPAAGEAPAGDAGATGQ